MTFRIYKITNKLTGQYYIGRTKKTLAQRLLKHKQDAYRGVNTYFYNAIRKYKINNFEIEQIYECLSEGEAIIKESFYIDTLNSFTPSGYNTTKLTNQGLIDSPEVNLKKRKSQQGTRRNNTNKFIGVTKNRNCKTYVASVQFENKPIYICGNTEKEAAESYDKLVLYIYGDDAKLNFPNKKMNIWPAIYQIFSKKSKIKKY
jgi:group I intron endonuclease